MSLFDFEEEIERERGNVISDRDRAMVRTNISRQRLPEAVREAGWHFVPPDEPVDILGETTALVVGVAAWSAPDLHALDALSSSVSRTDIWVFDIDDYERADQLAERLPGVKAPTQTPIVAKYENGSLMASAEGAEALLLLSKHAV